MNKITVKQVGRKCQVIHNNEVVLESGRVACKGFALGLHLETGHPYFNIKANGAEVLVREGFDPATGEIRGAKFVLTSGQPSR